MPKPLFVSIKSHARYKHKVDIHQRILEKLIGVFGLETTFHVDWHLLGHYPCSNNLVVRVFPNGSNIVSQVVRLHCKYTPRGYLGKVCYILCTANMDMDHILPAWSGNLWDIHLLLVVKQTLVPWHITYYRSIGSQLQIKNERTVP